jgi:hypothetical protein
MSEDAFKRFEYFIEGVKMSVKQAIRKDPPTEVRAEDEKKS